MIGNLCLKCRCGLQRPSMMSLVLQLCTGNAFNLCSVALWKYGLHIWRCYCILQGPTISLKNHFAVFIETVSQGRVELRAELILSLFYFTIRLIITFCLSIYLLILSGIIMTSIFLT